MNLKDRLKDALQHTRGFTDTILSEITTPDDWIRRPTAAANHALWIAGHLGYATNAFIGFVDTTKKTGADNFGTLFGKGSQPLDDLNAYPAPGEVAAYLTERGNVFLELLDQCSEDDLAHEVKEGPAFMYDVAAVFQMAVWHESLHTGQLTVIHRMLGQTPIADR